MARGVALAAIPCSRINRAKSLAPFAQALLVDAQPLSELVLSFHNQMHVRVLLFGMQDHGVAMLREFLAGEFPRGGQNLVWRRRRRNGEDDVVHEFRRPPRSIALLLPAVLPGGELQVPLIKQLLLLFRVSDELTLVGLDL